MQQCERTCYLLADSIKELMEEAPLEKITVKDIVENCNLTRQTFYRYFKDKYDLVNWYFEKLAQKSFKQMGISCTLKEGLMKKFRFIRNEKRFFTEAFLVEDCNSLLNYDYECIYDFYKEKIIRKTGELDDKTAFLLSMYCHGSISMTVEWVKNDMKLSDDELSNLLIEAMPEHLHGLLFEF